MANDEPVDGGDGGGESDPATFEGINLGAFLTDSESIDGVSFDLASGIKPVRVAQAAIGTVAFAIAYGVNSVIEGVSEAATRIVDGVGEFVADGLIASTLGVGTSAIEGAWSFSLTQFGVGAYPLALVAMIATFYVASWGANTAQEVLE